MDESLFHTSVVVNISMHWPMTSYYHRTRWKWLETQPKCVGPGHLTLKCPPMPAQGWNSPDTYYTPYTHRWCFTISPRACANLNFFCQVPLRQCGLLCHPAGWQAGYCLGSYICAFQGTREVLVCRTVQKGLYICPDSTWCILQDPAPEQPHNMQWLNFFLCSWGEDFRSS